MEVDVLFIEKWRFFWDEKILHIIGMREGV